MKKPISPPEFAHFIDDWHLSPVLDTGEFVFLSGITGVRADDSLADAPETQFRDAFAILGRHLEAAELGFEDIVGPTTYHVGLRAHLEAFVRVKDAHIAAPYPAWSVIGVSELFTPGTIVELRVIARRR